MKVNFEKELRSILCDEAIFLNEPMKEHTSFRIGGPCEWFLKLSSVGEAVAVKRLCEKAAIPFFILGKGSNLLVNDEGLKGVVAVLSGALAEAKREGNRIRVGAGMTLKDLADFSKTEGLSGLEFASGIPGTVGGAIFMNAGAYGGEIKDVLVEAELYAEGELRVYRKEELGFSYRKSAIQEMEGAVVLSATFLLEPDSPSDIQARIDDLNARRSEKQPLELPSAGSTFKRPKDGFASKLIDEAGLRGYRIGGAEVSKKHTGFIVNVDEATAEDVKKLIAYIQEAVEKKSGIKLVPEVRLL